MNPAYLHAVFAWDNTEPLPSSFAIITAYHQNGRISPDSRNRHQDATLHQVLLGRGLKPVRVVGMSPDGEHREPSWAVAVDEASALALGRLFKQEAVFLIREGRLFVYQCSQKQRSNEEREVEMGVWPSAPNAPMSLAEALEH